MDYLPYPLSKENIAKTPGALSKAPSNARPEWLRLPAPSARCPYTGLSRSTLNELIIPGVVNDHRPPVRSVVVKKRGATRGIRLISYDSLMGYLDSLANEPETPKDPEPK